MTKQYVGESPSKIIDSGDHLNILSLLPEYVTILVLDQQPPAEWQTLEQHLSRCAACRSEADALLNLMTEAYSDMLPQVSPPDPPDLGFLTQNLNLQPSDVVRPIDTTSARSTRLTQPVIIQFSLALLPTMRVVQRAGDRRLRYAYEISPTDNASPTIIVEVRTTDDKPEDGLVRICVEHPGREPFDQAGHRVTLQAGDIPRSALTDRNGIVMFADVPLEQIASWQITVEPSDAPAG